MQIEVHVFMPFQGQLRCLYDNKREAQKRIFTSDPKHDLLVIGPGPIKYQSHHSNRRPITCRELVQHPDHLKKWGPQICDIIESRIASFFAQCSLETLYTHNFGPGLTLSDSTKNSILGTFCLVSK